MHTRSGCVLTAEALAHFFQMAGRIPEAMDWYQRFVNHTNSLMWEPVQRVFAAYCLLAKDSLQKRDRVNAAKNLNRLFGLWYGADSDLQLRRDAIALRRQLDWPSLQSSTYGQGIQPQVHLQGLDVGRPVVAPLRPNV